MNFEFVAVRREFDAEFIGHDDFGFVRRKIFADFCFGRRRVFLNLMSGQKSFFAGRIFVAEFRQINQRELSGIESENFFATDVKNCAVDFGLDDRSAVGIQKLDAVSEIFPAEKTFSRNRHLVGIVRRQVQKFGIVLRQENCLFKRNQRACVRNLRGVVQGEQFQFRFDCRR